MIVQSKWSGTPMKFKNQDLHNLREPLDLINFAFGSRKRTLREAENQNFADCGHSDLFPTIKAPILQIANCKINLCIS